MKVYLDRDKAELVMVGTKETQFGHRTEGTRSCVTLTDGEATYEARVSIGRMLTMVDTAARNISRRTSDGPVVVKVKPIQ